jgi:ornithine cyclodeaminase/alanine dehydrogenase-like protein (mu-crystallin family)
MTDLRTGAAGAVAVKYTMPAYATNVIGFIGAGAIARNMARAAAAVRPEFRGVVYGLAGAEDFAADISAELGVPFAVAKSSKDLCSQANVIFTQTPGSAFVLELEWLQPGTTIIASGSDQR